MRRDHRGLGEFDGLGQALGRELRDVNNDAQLVQSVQRLAAHRREAAVFARPVVADWTRRVGEVVVTGMNEAEGPDAGVVVQVDERQILAQRQGVQEPDDHGNLPFAVDPLDVGGGEGERCAGRIALGDLADGPELPVGLITRLGRSFGTPPARPGKDGEDRGIDSTSLELGQVHLRRAVDAGVELAQPVVHRDIDMAIEDQHVLVNPLRLGHDSRLVVGCRRGRQDGEGRRAEREHPQNSRKTRGCGFLNENRHSFILQ